MDQSDMRRLQSSTDAEPVSSFGASGSDCGRVCVSGLSWLACAGVVFPPLPFWRNSYGRGFAFLLPIPWVPLGGLVVPVGRLFWEEFLRERLAVLLGTPRVVSPSPFSRKLTGLWTREPCECGVCSRVCGADWITSVPWGGGRRPPLPCLLFLSLWSVH